MRNKGTLKPRTSDSHISDLKEMGISAYYTLVPDSGLQGWSFTFLGSERLSALSVWDYKRNIHIQKEDAFL